MSATLDRSSWSTSSVVLPLINSFQASFDETVKCPGRGSEGLLHMLWMATSLAITCFNYWSCGKGVNKMLTFLNLTEIMNVPFKFRCPVQKTSAFTAFLNRHHWSDCLCSVQSVEGGLWESRAEIFYNTLCLPWTEELSEYCKFKMSQRYPLTKMKNRPRLSSVSSALAKYLRLHSARVQDTNQVLKCQA